MNNRNEVPKVPVFSKRLAALRNRLLDVVAKGEIGVSFSRDDMLAIAWALEKVSDPLLFTVKAPPGLDLPTDASDNSETWRYLPQRALLVPPDLGPEATELGASAPRPAKRGADVEAIEASAIAFAGWLTKLAMRVRNGEVSPEAAVWAATFVGEKREAERGALRVPPAPVILGKGAAPTLCAVRPIRPDEREAFEAYVRFVQREPLPTNDAESNQRLFEAAKRWPAIAALFFDAGNGEPR